MSTDKPLVSIIMPTYNSERFVSEAIKSVQTQDYKNWELLITDDCSTDSTTEIIRKFAMADSRIKLYELSQNSGAAVARNNSLALANGKYIAFLDSDDFWFKNKLEIQLNFMRGNNAAFTFTSYETVFEDGSPNNVIHVPSQINYNEYLRNTIIGCLTVVLDREKVGAIKMPDLRRRQDMATWLSILKRGIIAYGIDEPLAGYRIVSDSISHNKWKAAKGVWQVYRNIERLPLWKSSISFLGYAFNAIIKRLRYRS